jgi:hypothetical protein
VETNHLEDLGVDVKTILKWILNTLVALGLDCLAREKDKWQSFFKKDNKYLGSVKCGVILDQLQNYELLKKVSAPTG